LDAVDPATRDGFRADLSAALQIADAALVYKTRSDRACVFADWTAFCQEFGQDPSLVGVPGQEARLCYLLVYAYRRRQAISAQTGKPVRAGTVAKALLAVGKGIAALGQPDPRKQTAGAKEYHPLLEDFLGSLTAADDPTTRAHPANVTIIEHLPNVLDTEHATEGRANSHTIDLIVVGFYWLLRPAEYLYTGVDPRGKGRSKPFRLQDVTFMVDGRPVIASDASLNDWNETQPTRAYLKFYDQKNAVQGEHVSHAATTHPLLCPCKALARICAHLRAHACASDTPIYTYYDSNRVARHVTPKYVTNALRHAATSLVGLTGIPPNLLSARSLRPGGATALLCAGVDANIIQLLGRWKSDAMLRYLHVAVAANLEPFSSRMLDAGRFTFAPNAYNDRIHHPVPREAPRNFVEALEHEERYH
jgi:hypothetical protein